ncbi:NAD-specific glutamate dehydrogenase [Rothia kristinae]|nr:NAD-specific glutamate dehydrogenase [Rothia kristinae]
MQVVRTGRGWTLMIVTDDMPFLVSSVTAEVAGNHGGSDALFHPVFLVHRDPDTGALESLRGLETKQPVASGDTAAIPSLGPAVGKASAIESWISMDLSDVDDERSAQHLTAAIHRVLADVRRAHRDAEAVREKVLDLSERVGTLADPEQGTGPLRVQDAAPDAAEHPQVVREFLAWLARENFLFFGYKERDLREGPDGLSISDRPGTGLGILAEEAGTTSTPSRACSPDAPGTTPPTGRSSTSPRPTPAPRSTGTSSWTTSGCGTSTPPGG